MSDASDSRPSASPRALPRSGDVCRLTLLLCALCSSVSVTHAAPAAPGSAAQTIRLRCTADTNLSSYPSETNYNYGASSHIRLKGIEMWMLAKFDIAPVAGWQVQKASLWLHASGKHLLRSIGVSTVAVDWEEGTGTGDAARSGATFQWSDFGKRRWGGRQSDFTDAAWSRQHTIFHSSEIVEHPDGWLEVEVPPEYIYLLSQGQSYGLAITDEKGQTRANNDVDSREQTGFEPYLLITGAAEPTARPAQIGSAPGKKPGIDILQRPALAGMSPIPWTGGDPPARGGRLRVWAYGDCEKVDPVHGVLMEAGASVTTGQAVDPRRKSPVWDGATSTVHLSGGRNEFVAFQLCLEDLTPAPVNGQVSISELNGPGSARIPPGRLQVFRDWYVKDGPTWYPEVAIPNHGEFTIPDPQNHITGQQNTSLFLDLYIPHDATPGQYKGKITVAAAGIQPFDLPLDLTVWRLTLPDKLSFNVDLNAYSPPGDASMELKFHRMAHEHRATMDILGYSQSGHPNPDYVPTLEGSGAGIHVKDWSAFDRRFGPYFDGSAFAGLPRSGVPLHNAYLPFCEGWPSDIKQHYRYTPTTTAYPDIIVEHALRAPPIEEAFDNTFREEFSAIVQEFARHFKKRGWTQTQFQFYLNDKYDFRDPRQGGHGSSWWLLDEPMSSDDFLALQFFGRLFKRAASGVLQPQSPGNPQILFRCDISRPQWQRNWLIGLIDLICVSDELYHKNERCLDQHRTEGVILWNYGTGNAIRESNLAAESWALKAYLAGADCIVPWNSLGPDTSFDTPTPTTLLYPGGRFGINGPLASLRLKAMRRGQQDVEYLALLARARGWNREQVLPAVASFCGLPGGTGFVDDSGHPLFDRLTAAQTAALRAGIAAALR